MLTVKSSQVSFIGKRATGHQQCQNMTVSVTHKSNSTDICTVNILYTKQCQSDKQIFFYRKFTLQKRVSNLGSKLALNFRKELKSVFGGKAFHALMIR